MPITAMGPTYAGGEEPLLHEQSGYRLLFLPDVNNWELQRAGERPVFYWVPSQVRLARKNGPDAGDYLFNMIRFSGVQTAESTVGAEQDREVAGGVLSFTITGAPPDKVLQELQQQIVAKYQAHDDYFWGIRANREPIFRPAIITSNVTTISNVSPLPGGATPTRDAADRSRLLARGNPLAPRHLPRSARESTGRDASNLDPWCWQMQGQGNGSISPSGQNAYMALLGAYPTAILWAAFHGVSSPITATQALMLKVWSPVVELTIRGEWKKIFDHFSAAMEAHYLWASVDIKAEFNRMRTEGGIEVDIKIDSTLPNGDKILENIEKRTDLVFDKFMEEAKKMIFEPPPPNVPAAEASSGSGFWGVGLALKYRHDDTSLKLEYHEKRQLAYLQQHVISSSLSGMLGEPDAEKKYFLTVALDDWPRKLARVVSPICAWGDKAVALLSVDVGYPNSAGDLMWEGHQFQENTAEPWKYRIGQKNQTDVQNPPPGWTSDKTYIKRRVHLNEPPSALQDPYRRIQIEGNKIELDPGPNGTLLNDNTIEVRADSAGRLAVGPIGLGVVLQDNTQAVEAVLEATDDRGNPDGHEPVRFTWNFDDQQRDRLWLVYTGDPIFRPFFRYKVRVLVKGTIFEPGMEWEGPWVTSSGNGPVTLSIPQRGAQGVTVVRSATREFLAREPAVATAAAALPAARERSTPTAPAYGALRGWPISTNPGIANAPRGEE